MLSVHTPLLSKSGFSYPSPADAEPAVDAVANEYASYDAKEPRGRAKGVNGVQWGVSDWNTHDGDPLSW